MLRRQERLAGRIAGYHRLARWVATRQPLSLAAPRVARPPALVPLAALRDDLMAIPIEDENAQRWQIAVESASPLAQSSPEPELAAASVTPARPEERASPPTAPPLSARVAQTDRTVARVAAAPQQGEQPVVPIVNTQAASAARDERAIGAVLPADTTASAVPALPRAIPVANDDGGGELPSAAVPLARAEPLAARAIAGTDALAGTDAAVVSVEVARGVAAPAQSAPADPSSPLAPLDNDAVVSRRAVSADAVADVDTALSVYEGEDRVLKNEQRRDSRPLAERAATPRSAAALPTPIVPTDAAVVPAPIVTTDEAVASASTVNTSENGSTRAYRRSGGVGVTAHRDRRRGGGASAPRADQWGGRHRSRSAAPPPPAFAVSRHPYPRQPPTESRAQPARRDERGSRDISGTDASERES